MMDTASGTSPLSCTVSPARGSALRLATPGAAPPVSAGGHLLALIHLHISGCQTAEVEPASADGPPSSKLSERWHSRRGETEEEKKILVVPPGEPALPAPTPKPRGSGSSGSPGSLQALQHEPTVKPATAAPASQPAPLLPGPFRKVSPRCPMRPQTPPKWRPGPPRPLQGRGRTRRSRTAAGPGRSLRPAPG